LSLPQVSDSAPLTITFPSLQISTNIQLFLLIGQIAIKQFYSFELEEGVMLTELMYPDVEVFDYCVEM